MAKLAIYMEFDGMAVDENGNPVPAGAKLDFGVDMPEGKTYAELTENVDPCELMAAFGLQSLSDGHEGRIITPEEYDEKYGED